MDRPRTIAVVTGSRAEYGLLAPVMRAIDAHPKLRLRVVAAGLHLAQGTWRDIAFPLAAKVEMQKPRQTGRGHDVAALGRGVIGFGRVLAQLQPDVVLVLGDRIEALAAALAASVGGFHLAHVHGGDRAEGVADEAMRHAITKLAHLHFPATARSRQRLIRMGERPATVFNVGSPAIDGLDAVQPSPEADLIVLQHPIGAGDGQEQRWMRGTLSAVRGHRVVILAPNHDPGSAGIRRALRGRKVIEHLERGRFLSLLAGARALVGNSSAGLIEAAALQVACVNIGPRQSGREKPANVVDCGYGEANVTAALGRALRLRLGKLRHPYGDGRSGRRIADRLARVPLGPACRRKHNTY